MKCVIIKKTVVAAATIVFVGLVVPIMPAPIGSDARAGEDCATVCDGARVACRMYCSNNEGNRNEACRRFDDDDDRARCIRESRAKVRGCYDNCDLLWSICRKGC